MILEACVETIEQAKEAYANGAHRIEFCAALEQDGLSPDPADVMRLKQEIQIPVKCMARPRAGNFVYSEEEIDETIQDIQALIEAGADGIVLGCLTEENEIDIEALKKLKHACGDLPITFHKAIDLVPDIQRSVQQLEELGIEAVLTSGGAPTAAAGSEILGNLVVYTTNIEVIVAGGVTSSNIEQLHQQIQATAYHGKRIVSKL